VLAAENASGAIVITSTIFTQEARNFAAGKPTDLVDGGQLESMIGQVQDSSPGGIVASKPEYGSRYWRNSHFA